MNGDHTVAAPAVLFLRLDSSWNFVDDIRRFYENDVRVLEQFR